jgi:hypothetical protein
MDYSKFTEIYGILRADAARYAAIFVSPIIHLYSTAHRPAVNQSRIKIANSDGAKKIKQYKTKFILLFTHLRASAVQKV